MYVLLVAQVPMPVLEIGAGKNRNWYSFYWVAVCQVRPCKIVIFASMLLYATYNNYIPTYVPMYVTKIRYMLT